MIAGLDHTAAHASTGRLYVLMQQGTVDEFEAPGSSVWVFDVATMEKRQEIEMEELTMSIDVSQDDAPRLYALDLHIPLNTLATLSMYVLEGEESLQEVIRQRANVFDADTGEHLLASELIPHGFVVGISAW